MKQLMVVRIARDKNGTPLYTITDGKYSIEFTPPYMKRHLFSNLEFDVLKKELKLGRGYKILGFSFPFIVPTVGIRVTKQHSMTLSELTEEIKKTF